MTNSDIWGRFDLRPGDIVVSTPPKCGTTWTQAIILMLIHQTTELEGGIWGLSPWLDCAFRDADAQAAELAAQPHRRCIKTHTPLDGITFSPDADYVVVYRHPIDVHFSMRKHAANMKADWLDYMFPGNIHEGVERFISGDVTQGGTDDLTVASIIQHYRSFRQVSENCPNIHFVHYADMSADPAREIRRLAEVLRIDCSPDFLSEIVKATSFGEMKANAEKLARGNADSAFKRPSEFFSTGTSNKWDGILTDDEIVRFEDRIATLLPGADGEWLKWGATPPNA